MRRERVRRIDEVVDRAVESDRIVGAAVLVAAQGVVEYARSVGFADREVGVRVSRDTVFRLASLTKPIVAAVALALMEHGSFDLDCAVTRFLPDFRPRLAGSAEPEITVRHLLTHTAGLSYPADEPADPYMLAGISNGLDQPGLSMADNVRAIAEAPLYYAPGSAWRYSVATDVLGAVIEVAYGGTLAEAVSELVTEPLGLHDTAFWVADPTRLAVPYANAGDRPVRMSEPRLVGDFVLSPARVFDTSSFQSGGAGMVGTAGDFLTFLEVLRSGGAPILTADSIALASRNHVGTLRENESPGCGFGLFSEVVTDPRVAGMPVSPGTLHWGGVWGNYWLVDPGTGTTLVSLTNTTPEGCLGAFPGDLRAALYAD